jgi:hypothetical protein
MYHTHALHIVRQTSVTSVAVSEGETRTKNGRILSNPGKIHYMTSKVQYYSS